MHEHSERGPKSAQHFAIALHGGAGAEPGRLSPGEQQRHETSLAAALRTGERILEDSGSAMDAVEQTVRALEDDPLFNAGRGSFFNHEGQHELDAAIMEGRSRMAGAVAGVTTVKNPISLARLVMKNTKHVLLAGPGAERFANEMRAHADIEIVSNDYFSTAARREQWRAWLARPDEVEGERQAHRGTVGCVALDVHGNVAAGTSTGGTPDKRWGRIGDSPIIGAGTYADNATCAVSCTGTGERFMLHCAAFHVAALMAYQQLSLTDATSNVLSLIGSDGGGMIAIDRQGNVAMPFNTPGMFRAAIDGNGIRLVAAGS